MCSTVLQPESKRFVLVEPGIHCPDVVRHMERNGCGIEHVALEVDARRDLSDRQPSRPELDYAALGDEYNLLAGFERALAAERDLSDFGDQLGHAAVLQDPHGAVANLDSPLAGVEVATENDSARRRRDVRAAAHSRRDVCLAWKERDVDVAVPVDLHERQAGGVKTPALEKRELVWARHDRVRVVRTPERKARERITA